MKHCIFVVLSICISKHFNSVIGLFVQAQQNLNSGFNQLNSISKTALPEKVSSQPTSGIDMINAVFKEKENEICDESEILVNLRYHGVHLVGQPYAQEGECKCDEPFGFYLDEKKIELIKLFASKVNNGIQSAAVCLAKGIYEIRRNQGLDRKCKIGSISVEINGNTVSAIDLDGIQDGRSMKVKIFEENIKKSSERQLANDILTEASEWAYYNGHKNPEEWNNGFTMNEESWSVSTPSNFPDKNNVFRLYRRILNYDDIKTTHSMINIKCNYEGKVKIFINGNEVFKYNGFDGERAAEIKLGIDILKYGINYIGIETETANVDSGVKDPFKFTLDYSESDDECSTVNVYDGTMAGYGCTYQRDTGNDRQVDKNNDPSTTEGGRLLIDNDPTTKCYVGKNTADLWISDEVIFKDGYYVYFNKYTIWTANDKFDERNPKSWKIQGSMSHSINLFSDWTDLIHSINGYSLPHETAIPTNFTINRSDYKVFNSIQLLITETTMIGGSGSQIGEIKFYICKPKYCKAKDGFPIATPGSRIELLCDSQRSELKKMGICNNDGEWNITGECTSSPTTAKPTTPTPTTPTPTTARPEGGETQNKELLDIITQDNEEIVLDRSYVIEMKTWTVPDSNSIKFKKLIGKGENSRIILKMDSNVEASNNIKLFNDLDGKILEHIYFVIESDNVENSIKINDNGIFNKISNSYLYDIKLTIKNSIEISQSGGKTFGIFSNSMENMIMIHMGIIFENKISIYSQNHVSTFGLISGSIKNIEGKELSGLYVKGNEYSFTSTRTGDHVVHEGLFFGSSENLIISYSYSDVNSITVTCPRGMSNSLTVAHGVASTYLKFYRCFAIVRVVANVKIDDWGFFGPFLCRGDVTETVDECWSDIQVGEVGGKSEIVSFRGMYQSSFAKGNVILSNSYINYHLTKSISSPTATIFLLAKFTQPESSMKNVYVSIDYKEGLTFTCNFVLIQKGENSALPRSIENVIINKPSSINLAVELDSDKITKLDENNDIKEKPYKYLNGYFANEDKSQLYYSTMPRYDEKNRKIIDNYNILNNVDISFDVNSNPYYEKISSIWYRNEIQLSVINKENMENSYKMYLLLKEGNDTMSVSISENSCINGGESVTVNRWSVSNSLVYTITQNINKDLCSEKSYNKIEYNLLPENRKEIVEIIDKTKDPLYTVSYNEYVEENSEFTMTFSLPYPSEITISGNTKINKKSVETKYLPYEYEYKMYMSVDKLDDNVENEIEEVLRICIKSPLFYEGEGKCFDKSIKIRKETISFADIITQDLEEIVLNRSYVIEMKDWTIPNSNLIKFKKLIGKGENSRIILKMDSNAEASNNIKLFNDLDGKILEHIYFVIESDNVENVLKINDNGIFNKISNSYLYDIKLTIKNSIEINQSGGKTFGIFSNSMENMIMIHMGIIFENKISINSSEFESTFGLISGSIKNIEGKELSGLYVKGNEYSFTSTRNTVGQHLVHEGLFFGSSENLIISYSYSDVNILNVKCGIGISNSLTVAHATTSSSYLKFYRCFAIVRESVNLEINDWGFFGPFLCRGDVMETIDESWSDIKFGKLIGKMDIVGFRGNLQGSAASAGIQLSNSYIHYTFTESTEVSIECIAKHTTSSSTVKNVYVSITVSSEDVSLNIKKIAEGGVPTVTSAYIQRPSKYNVGGSGSIELLDENNDIKEKPHKYLNGFFSQDSKLYYSTMPRYDEKNKKIIDNYNILNNVDISFDTNSNPYYEKSGSVWYRNELSLNPQLASGFMLSLFPRLFLLLKDVNDEPKTIHVQASSMTSPTVVVSGWSISNSSVYDDVLSIMVSFIASAQSYTRIEYKILPEYKEEILEVVKADMNPSCSLSYKDYVEENNEFNMIFTLPYPSEIVISGSEIISQDRVEEKYLPHEYEYKQYMKVGNVDSDKTEKINICVKSPFYYGENGKCFDLDINIHKKDPTKPTTTPPTTQTPTTIKPSTAIPTTSEPTTVKPTETPTTIKPTQTPTTIKPTQSPTTIRPTTIRPTTIRPTTTRPTTIRPTTIRPTTVRPTTIKPTTLIPTTVTPSTVIPTTETPTTVIPSTNIPSTSTTVDTGTIGTDTIEPTNETSVPTSSIPTTIMPTTPKPIERISIEIKVYNITNTTSLELSENDKNIIKDSVIEIYKNENITLRRDDIEVYLVESGRRRILLRGLQNEMGIEVIVKVPEESTKIDIIEVANKLLNDSRIIRDEIKTNADLSDEDSIFKESQIEVTKVEDKTIYPTIPNNNNGDNDDDSSGLSTGALIGIIAGGVVVLIIIIVGIVLCRSRKSESHPSKTKAKPKGKTNNKSSKPIPEKGVKASGKEEPAGANIEIPKIVVEEKKEEVKKVEEVKPKEGEKKEEEKPKEEVKKEEGYVKKEEVKPKEEVKKEEEKPKEEVKKEEEKPKEEVKKEEEKPKEEVKKEEEKPKEEIKPKEEKKEDVKPHPKKSGSKANRKRSGSGSSYSSSSSGSYSSSYSGSSSGSESESEKPKEVKSTPAPPPPPPERKDE